MDLTDKELDGIKAAHTLYELKSEITPVDVLTLWFGYGLLLPRREKINELYEKYITNGKH